MLSPEEQEEIDEKIKLFPRKQAASTEALRIVQKHRGWVSDESIEDIAAQLEMSPAELDNVATFYSLIFRKPVGRNVILLCESVSCFIMDYQKILDHLQERLGVKFGETTPDERFTLLPIPCLGSCDHAPAMMVNDDLHKDLTEEKIDEILKKYE